MESLDRAVLAFVANALWQVPLVAALAFHPVTRLVRRRIAAAREIACDELAVARFASPRAYARALLAVAAHLAGLPRPAQTLGVFDAGILEERMRQLTDHAHSIAPARARRRFAAALLVLIAAGSLSNAVAIEVKPRAARPELAPFAGTWIGYLPGNTSPREPAVELTVSPSGRVELTMIRLHRTPDGTTSTTRIALPVANVEGGVQGGVEGGVPGGVRGGVQGGVEGGVPGGVAGGVLGARLSFRTRVEDFTFGEWPPGPAETTWTVEIQPDGRAILTSGDNSYFAAARARGQEVPPPPPPTVLERQGSSPR